MYWALETQFLPILGSSGCKMTKLMTFKVWKTIYVREELANILKEY